VTVAAKLATEPAHTFHFGRQARDNGLSLSDYVLDAANAIVQLMQASPWLKVLVTSREVLHVRGERRFPFGAVAPGAHALQRGDLLALGGLVAVVLRRRRQAPSA